MRTSKATLLLLVACLPPEPPDWLITEPTFLGIQSSVVADGPHAEGLTVYPGNIRANPLPLDTLELRLLAATPPGVTLRPPIWFRCVGYSGLSDCYEALIGVAPPDCPAPLPLSPSEVCRLGTGDSLRAQIADIDTLASGQKYASIGALAITSAELDPEACVTRIRDAAQDLTPCMIATRFVGFGPSWRFAELRPSEDPDIPDDLPDEIREAPVDTNPWLYFAIQRTSAPGETQLAVDGDTVTVRAGETISVTVEPGDDAAQLDVFLVEDPDDPDASLVKTTPEELSYATFLAGPVELSTAHADDRTLTFVVPDTLEPVLVFASIDDDRSGIGAASLRFLAIRGGHEPP